ncbi:penicillin-binding protein, partial [Candidatus Uhrbacteria bacterium]|nr:penicillin-binding protein [Candidatus Uhrbacteria bacterium]
MAGYLRRAARSSVLAIVATVAAIGCAVAGFTFVIVRQAQRELPTPVALRQERLEQDTIVVDRDGRRIAALRRGDMHREVVPYETMNPVLRDAVVAAEDERFWTHHGVDPYGVARAFVRNVTNGRRVQGGSTITQQLLKLTLLQGRPPLLRKVEEAMLAQRFERLLTKEQLLSLYLNAVYLGGGNAGVEAASRDLFGIPSSQVSLGQAALLVGAIPAPSNRSPLCEPEAARQQQRRVLRRMVEERLLASGRAERVATEAIRFRLADDGFSDADTATVLDLVTTLHPTHESDRIATTIDLPLQRRSLVALRATLERYARARGEHRGPRFVLNAAVRERWLADLHTFRETLREWGTGVRERLVYDLRQVAPSATPSLPCRYGSAVFRSAVPQGFASGVVVAVDTEIATLDLGDFRGTISAAAIAWTGKPLATVAP